MPSATRRLAGAIALLAALVVSPLATATIARGPESGTGNIVVYANLASHTSLRVSSSQLVFEADAKGNATASVDYTAGARTSSGGEVVLTVESEDVRVQATNGSAVPVLEIDGAALAGPTIARRWSGSGMREGRLQFTLRGVPAGTYVVPVKFLLTAP